MALPGLGTNRSLPSRGGRVKRVNLKLVEPSVELATEANSG